MSSIESMVSEIEEDYHRILKSFESYVDPTEGYYRFKKISENELLKLLRDVMNFQRKLEYFIEFTIRLSKNTEYTKRLREIADKLLNKLSNVKEIDTVGFWHYQSAGSYQDEFNIVGVIPELKQSHKDFLHNNETSSRRSCYCAYFGFKSLSSNLIEMEEELRLIGALTTYPIEKKTRLKHQLVINDFEEVAVSLEEAESNVESEHFKDSVSRCRDAVEILIAFVREQETGEKTERHFATDLAKIVKIGVFDEGTQKLAQGIYSFLSLKGSHKYDAKKVTVYDAETALKETYSLIEMLLKKYLDLKKDKTRKE